ncbi:MAG: DUF262 domain-containing protein [Okeania sp. SIO3I5]|uniref:DUF262 domain-containing protein n=1 Tax=Okeania sp. SIO3I5 TaxID=2607805 RepID=UPI0013BB73E8|nr:DUF262 domain-containing protein [Okeania sp. SIO3I5]NEQ38944.1 DUF262 domain-containing protein [Okeania sp. SIO3I5]
MRRTINFQTISWFWDLYQRELLDLDPSYQRRSVWNQNYKDDFIDTVLHQYPAPAIFIYQEITPEGVSKVSVVDGKQRLSTLFQFVDHEFPVHEKTKIQRFSGKYFKDLDIEDKQEFWRYKFAIEYLPSSNESIIGDIFNRINRNVIKLTPQELRHARLSGDFITLAEELSTWMFKYLEEKSKNFPNLNSTSRKQMKDVEIVAQLLLFLEEGAKSYSADYLDRAFTNRDSEWEEKDEIEDEFRETIKSIGKILDLSKDINLAKTRLKNQADFYSLFGAIAELNRENMLDTNKEVGSKIYDFLKIVENKELHIKSKHELNDCQQKASDYYKAAKFSFTDAGPRKVRIEIIKSLLKGDIHLEES